MSQVHTNGIRANLVFVIWRRQVTIQAVGVRLTTLSGIISYPKTSLLYFGLIGYPPLTAPPPPPVGDGGSVMPPPTLPPPQRGNEIPGGPTIMPTSSMVGTLY
ncbi:hypothetical protein G9A89_000453 [Geosiphon pyriformis]|nr:hypothetical protein G9A89_000453 [Geosiphon pyriformis]